MPMVQISKLLKLRHNHFGQYYDILIIQYFAIWYVFTVLLCFVLLLLCRHDITWTHLDYSSVWIYGIHQRAISQEMLNMSIIDVSLKSLIPIFCLAPRGQSVKMDGTKAQQNTTKANRVRSVCTTYLLQISANPKIQRSKICNCQSWWCIACMRKRPNSVSSHKMSQCWFWIVNWTFVNNFSFNFQMELEHLH